MHNVTDRQTGRQTDGQKADANSRSYCVAVRSANKTCAEYWNIILYDDICCVYMMCRKRGHDEVGVPDSGYVAGIIFHLIPGYHVLQVRGLP